jgi:hypothetical protein
MKLYRGHGLRFITFLALVDGMMVDGVSGELHTPVFFFFELLMDPRACQFTEQVCTDVAGQFTEQQVCTDVAGQFTD